jgi:putative flippase GtrA
MLMGALNQLLRFSVVGLLNTLAGVSLIFWSIAFLELDDVAANALGYGLGLLISFFLNRHWTFRHDGPLTPAFASFLVVQLVAYVLNLVCVLGLIEFGVGSYSAQAWGVVPYSITSYLGSRYLVFSQASDLEITSVVLKPEIEDNPPSPLGKRDIRGFHEDHRRL